MTRKDINNSLVKNAFDFLNKAISDFPASPKYSVIHFYAAVELILKSRLLQEHWALVVTKPQDADWDKFLRGDFHSVGLKEANSRLKAISKDGLGNSAFDAFNALLTHRNRLMHFFHANLQNNQQQLESIVAEQSTAWFHLHDLITRQWSKYFKGWKREIRSLEFTMRQHREYLYVRFEAKAPEIEEEKLAGAVFVECSVCGFEAAKRELLLGTVFKDKCYVCEYSPEVLLIECPDCQQEVEFVGDGLGDCSGCNRSFEPEDIAEILIDHGAAHVALMDGDDSYGPINCGYCDGYQTVISYDDKYLCTSCLNLTDGYEICEWCNEGNTGDMEGSYYAGCNQCDGRAGWEKDD